MTPTDFIEWRERLSLNRKEAAEALGISQNTMTAYERGQRIPRHIALACTAIANNLPPWPWR